VVVWIGLGVLLGLHSQMVGSVVTMATLVMVFAVQHTSSREARALNVKVDELIRVTAARNELIGAEHEDHDALDDRRRELLDMRRSSDDTVETAPLDARPGG
jgi:low affinity Fe/Cu permease